MKTDYRCFYCFARAYENLLAKEPISNETKRAFTCEMAQLFLNSQDGFKAPVYSRELRQIFKHYTGNYDPYIDEKCISNDLALSLYPKYKELVSQSADSFDTALRLALAGNIIDFGIHHQYDLNGTITKVLQSKLAIDHSAELQRQLRTAKMVLYLGDNSGEIVFDRLFIETIAHPNVYFAVRGFPVINDVTIDDAIYTKMDSVAKIISNGYDAPSTILEKSSVEFNEIFLNADLVISKGQGNFEGLHDNTSKNIFFLLMTKCDVISEVLNTRKGDFVVKCNKMIFNN